MRIRNVLLPIFLTTYFNSSAQQPSSHSSSSFIIHEYQTDLKNQELLQNKSATLSLRKLETKKIQSGYVEVYDDPVLANYLLPSKYLNNWAAPVYSDSAALIQLTNWANERYLRRQRREWREAYRSRLEFHGRSQCKAVHPASVVNPVTSDEDKLVDEPIANKREIHTLPNLRSKRVYAIQTADVPSIPQLKPSAVPQKQVIRIYFERPIGYGSKTRSTRQVSNSRSRSSSYRNSSARGSVSRVSQSSPKKGSISAPSE